MKIRIAVVDGDEKEYNLDNIEEARDLIDFVYEAGEANVDIYSCEVK